MLPSGPSLGSRLQGLSAHIPLGALIRSLNSRLIAALAPSDYFLRGDQVEVRDGTLKGLAGEVIRLDGHDRLVIRIDAIQHSVSVQIERRFLRALK